MSLLQKYRKEETRKTTPEEERGESKKQEEPVKEIEKEKPKPKVEKAPLPPKTPKKKRETKSASNTAAGARTRPVISATVSLELVDALSDLTNEKYLNRSKFIEDALIRTIKAEFPDIADRYGF